MATHANVPPFSHEQRNSDENEKKTATLKPTPELDEAANPKKRKLHVLWVIVPILIAAILYFVFWGGIHVMTETSPHEQAQEQQLNTPPVSNENYSTSNPSGTGK